MGRKRFPPPAHVADGTTTEILQSKGRAQAEQAQHSQAVASAFGEGLPYERERSISKVRLCLATGAEAMLEAGRELIQIKENEPYGDFLEIVERRLGLTARTAQRMMAAAAKFLSKMLAAKATTLSPLGKSKLFELMVEDDDDLAELAKGGTLAGATLGEIETMTCRELRAALREARGNTEQARRRAAKKQEEIDALKDADELRRFGRPDERERQQITDTRDVGVAADLILRRLVMTVAMVFNAPASESAELQARQTLDYIADLFANLCAEQNIAIDLFGEHVEPGWRREITDMVDAAKASKPSKDGRQERGGLHGNHDGQARPAGAGSVVRKEA